MIKPSERVLVGLNTLDQAVVEWLSKSLDALTNELIDAPSERVGRLQGAAQEVRSILNSARGADEAIRRIRSE
jgi:hypothetical protein